MRYTNPRRHRLWDAAVLAKRITTRPFSASKIRLILTGPAKSAVFRVGWHRLENDHRKELAQLGNMSPSLAHSRLIACRLTRLRQ